MNTHVFLLLYQNDMWVNGSAGPIAIGVYTLMVISYLLILKWMRNSHVQISKIYRSM